MVDIKVDASEWTELTVRMRAGIKRVDQESRQVVRRNTFRVEAGAKQRCPVDTGFLRESIVSAFALDPGGAAFVGVVSAEANYGIYVERGTSRARAQPFMRPAAMAVRPVFAREAAQLGASLLSHGGAR